MPSAHLLPPLPSFHAPAASAIPTTSTGVTLTALAYGSKTTTSDKSVEQLLATQLTSLLQNAAAAASSANQTDKVIIAPGLPAIPTKLLKKMHNWEYIELSQLLPQSSSHDAAMDAQRFALFPGFELVRVKPQKMIANIGDWMKCFTTYVVAMAIKFPESVTEMLAYQLVIIKASQQYDGLYWRVYDIHFRVNAAASGNRKWSQLDTDLYTRFFTGRAREVPYCLLCDAISHTDAQCPQNTGRKRPQPSHALLTAKKRKWSGNVCFSRLALASLQTASMSTSAACALEITQLSSVLNLPQLHQARGSSLQSDRGAREPCC